ncbi:predicted protein [Naegleria gruberi]|uniref:RING-type E3 ubiquitin transferase n=1 Tax=Naegleria gruberi TaxID=5762 RepID=D2VVQ5_NAEGR|nr:uncharacterized protein NAEGRDRAFT_73105 [Naegleria gruberi]EFC39083.1 predicted protein [Naegleria gruberi]|eukprot:XP_002671827.1 predicted protein [Naegleria gruberi strain NEG-M]
MIRKSDYPLENLKSPSDNHPLIFPIFDKKRNSYHSKGFWRTIEGFYPVYNEQPKRVSNSEKKTSTTLKLFTALQKENGLADAVGNYLNKGLDIESMVNPNELITRTDYLPEDKSKLFYTNVHVAGSLKMNLVFKKTILRDYYFVYGTVAMRNGKYFLERENLLFLEGVYSLFTNQFHFILKPKKYLFYRMPDYLDKELLNQTVFNGDAGAELAYHSYVDHYIEELQEMGMDYDSYSYYSSAYHSQQDSVNFEKSKRESCVFKGLGIGKANIHDQKLKNFVESFETNDFNEILEWSLSGIVTGINCNHTLMFSQTFHDNSEFTHEVKIFLRISTLLSIFLIFGMLRQIKSTATRSAAQRISILFVGFTFTLSFLFFSGSLIFLFNFYSVFSISLALSFMSFLYLTCSIQYVLYIWKSHYPNHYENVVRASVFFFFWGFLMTVLFGGYYLSHVYPHLLRYILFIGFSFIVPQIISNFVYNTRKSVDLVYLTSLVVFFSFLVLYFGTRPENFLEFKTNYTYCFLILSYMYIQYGIFLAQNLIDPRLNILSTHLFGFMLPPKYNYHRPIPESMLEEGECKCVICMSEIEIPENDTTSDALLVEVNNNSTLTNRKKKAENYSSKDFMVTPCNHVFHTVCLEKWKEYKLECPLCKKDLPMN